ncbi:response regulator [Methylopila sp. 73B]|uniref:response regulator n=1 Tax=Methylopila sp. 73B TaxID=1120792 RepID=UPI00035E4AB7|nr:response regulator [Methylopila sp. 73B]
MIATASHVDDDLAPSADRRIAVAAHEIRTPLGGILALADLLLAEDLSEAARGHAAALKTAAEHLFGVASTLLGASAPQPRRELDFAVFLARVAPALSARAALKGLAFAATLDPRLPESALADEGALRQIVENLADNALRVTDRGRIELALEWAAEDEASVTLRIVVRDTGPGLGQRPERLFEPFVQGEGAPGGAGLGLSLVATLARDMGGGAAAANRPEGGAEVIATARLDRVTPAPPPLCGLRRVLVAEDNAVNQRVLGTLLEHFGLVFDIAPDGEAAVAAVATGRYDLVLMDATMPKMDGLDATRTIRALPAPLGHIRIVGVTARAFAEEIAAFRAAGVDDVVTKPISVGDLWSAIGAGAEQAEG